MVKKPAYGSITKTLLMGGSQPAPVMKVKTETINIVERKEVWTKKGLKPGETRTTFIVDEKTLEDFKLVAYWDHASIKDLINEAMQDVISNYVKKHGPLKPKKKRR